MGVVGIFLILCYCCVVFFVGVFRVFGAGFDILFGIFVTFEARVVISSLWWC